MSPYDQAVEVLFRTALSDFVAERKRLAGELKAAGDKDAAARLAKAARPSVSAWAVNQLWWRQRESFEAFLSAAAQLKVGDREATQRHREALAGLREHATRLLSEGGGASDATLRRVTTSLSALAATGGFAPDAPGALSADRDPPGFEALGFGPPRVTAEAPPSDAAAERAAEVERQRAEEAERQRRRAERERLSALLRDAQAVQTAQQRELTRLRADTEAAGQGLKQTQALLADLEQQLASL
jgi:hypothetical protein